MKKLRNKKGFTLTEMLISVVLLGFMSIMVTVMTTAIFSSTVTMREVAQAEILGSEALNNLQGQLRIAQSIMVGADGNITFDIDDDNKGYTFDVEDGKIVIGKKESETFKGDLLFAGVSYGSLNVTDLQFTCDKTSETIDIAVVISYAGKSLWKGSVTVKPLNGISIV